MNKMVSLLMLIILAGCSKESEKIISNTAPIAEMQITQGASQFSLDGTLSYDKENQQLTYQWSSSSGAISIASATASKTSFNIPSVAESFSTDITLEVNDGNKTNTTTQTILIPSSNQMETYGLGQQLSAGVSNNTDYSWYFDQGNSGTYSSVNCGPTSVTMAIKWANKSFAKTPENARQAYRSTGGWWYTKDIISYLNDNATSNYSIALTDISLLKDKINKGSIVILCLDMYYVSAENNSAYHIDKFYSASTQGWGHFIVIKGYKEVDSQTFFEVYDPFSFGKHYLDNSIKGQDRYYKAADLNNATNNWWDYAIIIPKPGLPTGRMAAPADAVDAAAIQHMPGK